MLIRLQNRLSICNLDNINCITNSYKLDSRHEITEKIMEV